MRTPISHKQLCEGRKRTDALRSRDVELIETNRDAAMLAYLRRSERGDVLVLLNFSDRTVRVEGGNVHSKAVLGRFLNARDLLSDKRLEGTHFSVDAMSALILVKP